MVLILTGKSQCAKCGKILSQGEELVGLPALFPVGHRLYKYSDAGFHRKCYESLDVFSDIESILKKLDDLKLQKPSVPGGMTFADFEKTEEYQSYANKLREILELGSENI